jgi:Predicted tRNA(5-methylaminomethyl-2-thiouridylate) methyltransferase, contains the PP-loop ATPase domain
MNTSPATQYDALALFSGGLDSLLAARLIQDMGLSVLCLHFTTPFFGKPQSIGYWEKTYGLAITPVDIGDEFVAMLAQRPEHGFGKVLNPCIDCKILMMRKALALMEHFGAKALISGEVLGQRPMSQRRDTLNVIRRDAGVRNVLVRPLSALLLEPSEAETSGLIDRERLFAISGRSRKDQLALAATMGITDIPAPAGGCRLTEKENARSYWPVLRHARNPKGADFELANTGRQYWSLPDSEERVPHWLCVGRNQADNAKLVELARPGDVLFKTAYFPGPVSLARPLDGEEWSLEAIRAAAAFTASFSPKASSHAREKAVGVRVKVVPGSTAKAIMDMAENRDENGLIEVTPDRKTPLGWCEHAWDPAKEELRAEARKRFGHDEV